MNATDLHWIADRLLMAEKSRMPIPPLTADHPELSVDDAYEVQAINARSHASRDHGKVVGYKIGLTAEPMQKMLGVDEPDFGHLFADRVSETGVELDTTTLIAPRIEPEIAFVLARDLPPGTVTAEQVVDATDYYLPALEVIDSRIADWKIKLVDTVADNASCASVVLGTHRTAPTEVDLTEAAVELRVDGKTERQGKGSAVLGHPAEAVAWLANTLSGYGVELQAGHVLMPGSLTAAVPLEAGRSFLADFGSLGTVEVSAR